MLKKRRRKKATNGVIAIDREQFDKLIDKLDTLIKMTAASVFRGEKVKEGIVFLTDFGFSAKDVAKVLDTSEQYVWNVSSEAKKQQQKKKAERIQKEKTPEPLKQETQPTTQ
jgi:DNA-directed RNA polymerase specialized sigma24 family protein